MNDNEETPEPVTAPDEPKHDEEKRATRRGGLQAPDAAFPWWLVRVPVAVLAEACRMSVDEAKRAIRALATRRIVDVYDGSAEHRAGWIARGRFYVLRVPTKIDAPESMVVAISSVALRLPDPERRVLRALARFIDENSARAFASRDELQRETDAAEGSNAGAA